MTTSETATGRSGEELARFALERVCSRADPAAAKGVYSADFVDHVNARDYEGHEGIAQSLSLYQLLFRDGEIVEDWSASDNLDLIRQLGVRRTLLLGLDWLRARSRP